MFDTTVIIPAYNREKFIGRAIQSALAQTVSPVNIFVIDDGSHDSTRTIANRYQPALRVLDSGERGSGPSNSRNVGIQAAKTEFVTFLDSDDCLEPEALELVKQAYEVCPGCGLVVCNWKTGLWDEKTNQDSVSKPNVASVVHSLPKKEVLPGVFHIESSIAHPALCESMWIKMNGATVRSHIFSSLGGFNLSLEVGNDIEMWLRILRIHSIIFIDRPLATVTRHRNNITTSNAEYCPGRSRRLIFSYCRTLKREYELTEYDTSKLRLKRKLGKLHLDAAYLNRKQGKLFAAAHDLARSFRWGGSLGAVLKEGCKLLSLGLLDKLVCTLRRVWDRSG